MAKHSPRIPAWLMGLIVAIVVFIAIIWIFSILGFGDDPVLETSARLLG